jgi:putative transposase
MPRAPQEVRTFFVTFNTWGRRPIFRSNPLAHLLLEVLRDNYKKRRFIMHAFVIMPDHVHMLLTPANDISLEKAIQYVKGGFSYRVKKEQGKSLEIWQDRFTEHRIKDSDDFDAHVLYVEENPTRAGLENWPFVWSERMGAGAKARCGDDPVSPA